MAVESVALRPQKFEKFDQKTLKQFRSMYRVEHSALLVVEKQRLTLFSFQLITSVCSLKKKISQ